MDRGRNISLLTTAGGVLLLLSHAAAWQLGRRLNTAAVGQAEVLSTRAREATPSPADLVRLGREHEAAELAATQEQREPEKLPWRDQVAAARAKLPANADLPALVRDGMAAAKAARNYADANTVAAFGKWLELDSDAALDFIGRASRGQWTDAFRFEIAHWLDQGKERHLDELLKRFPKAAEPLYQGAQALCRDRGADFALEIATSLAEPSSRFWLLYDCMDAKQWQGHLSRIPTVLADPRTIREFLSSLTRDADAAVLLDEIRAAGFRPEDVAQAETRIAENTEEVRSRELEREKDRKEREKSASGLKRQLVLAGTHPFDWNGQSEEQQIDKLASGFADACADLRDGRQSMDEVLALVQRTWPPASDPAVAKDLRSLVFDTAFSADPLVTLQQARALGWDCIEEAENGLEWLPPEMAIRVIVAHPDILQDKESEAFPLDFYNFRQWQEADPEGYRQALLAMPNESLLRTQLLERFDERAERMEKRKGGVR